MLDRFRSRLTRHHNLLTGSPPITGPLIKKGGGRVVGKKIGRKVGGGAITYVGSTKTGTTSSGPTLSLTGLTGGSDSSAAAGDLVVVCISIVFTTGNSTASITTPGYTQAADVTGTDPSSLKARHHVFYKSLTTAETEVVTATGSPPAVTVHVFRGVDAASPLDVATVTAFGNDTGQADPPAITPTSAGAWVFASGGGGWNTTTPFTSSDLAGFISSGNAFTSFQPIGGAGYFVWESGAFDPAQFGGGNTSTNSAWAAATMALRPA